MSKVTQHLTASVSISTQQTTPKLGCLRQEFFIISSCPMGWPGSAERSFTVPVKITAGVGVMWGPNRMDKDGSCFIYMSSASAGISRTAGFLEDLSLSPCDFLFGSFGLPYSMDVSRWLNYVPGFPRKNIPRVPGGGCKVSYDFVWEVTSVTLYPQNVSFKASPDSMGGDIHPRKLIDQFVDNLSLKSHNSGIRV